MYFGWMAWYDIPRTHSFSLGDFHDFDRCPFKFFVNHHLEKKYELAKGTPSQAVGTLLDLAIKKLHASRAYNQPWEYLQNLIVAAAVEMRDDVLREGPNSFYGSQVEFLTSEVIGKAKEVFKSYLLGIGGKVKRMVVTETLKKKPFWKMVVAGATPLKLWGGPDSIEMGEDEVPEIVDYKYLEKGDESTDYLDMDLMPKLYTLLCAQDLTQIGYSKARFMVRLWHDPQNRSFYEEFDLSQAQNMEDYFKDKMEKILRTEELSFCERDYCRACKSEKRPEWLKKLKETGWIKRHSAE